MYHILRLYLILYFRGRYLKRTTWPNCGIFRPFLYVKIMAMEWEPAQIELPPVPTITQEAITYQEFGWDYIYFCKSKEKDGFGERQIFVETFCWLLSAYMVFLELSLKVDVLCRCRCLYILMDAILRGESDIWMGLMCTPIIWFWSCQIKWDALGLVWQVARKNNCWNG